MRLVGPTSSPATREIIPQEAPEQRAQRQGNRDPRCRRGGRLSTMFDLPGMPGGGGWRHQPRRDAEQGHGRSALEAAPRHCAGQLRSPDRGRERQAHRQRANDERRHPRGREQRHRIPRRGGQDLLARRLCAIGRRGLARRRAARSAAAHRRHDGVDQVRAGEDRPRAVHRVRRVPCGEAVRPSARAAGPLADPRRAQCAARARIFAAS